MKFQTLQSPPCQPIKLYARHSSYSVHCVSVEKKDLAIFSHRLKNHCVLSAQLLPNEMLGNTAPLVLLVSQCYQRSQDETHLKAMWGGSCSGHLQVNKYHTKGVWQNACVCLYGRLLKVTKDNQEHVGFAVITVTCKNLHWFSCPDLFRKKTVDLLEAAYGISVSY